MYTESSLKWPEEKKTDIGNNVVIFDQGWQLCSGEAMNVNRKIFYRNLTYFEIDFCKKNFPHK